MNNNEASASWFDKIKNYFKSYAEQLDLSVCKIIEILSYFAVGFFIGFLIKRYSKYVIICLVVLILSLFLLDNFNFISIDWNKIREITGISTSDTVGKIFRKSLEWLKNNLPMVLSLFIGFLIGYKIGEK